MNSAQLYLKLQQSGERVLQALANERDVDVLGPGDFSYRKWEEHLSLACEQVECAAERYAIALRSYRLAMLTEIDRAEPVPTRRVRLVTKRRDSMLVGMDGRNRRPCRKLQRNGTSEGFPTSTRRAKG